MMRNMVNRLSPYALRFTVEELRYVYLLEALA